MIDAATLPSQSLENIFENLKISFLKDPNPPIKQRIHSLKKLRRSILQHHQDIIDALKLDLNKSAFETEASEILVSLREIDKAIRNLKYWTQDRSVEPDWLLFGTSSYIRYEPKGIVLIISPWNYPLNLCITPFVAAISAGNKAILKPSEFAPNTSKVISNIIESVFSNEEVAVVEGDASIAAELCQLPFNLIFFTGSQAIGKKVLQEAAHNLTPITLEMGGKCPVIVDPSYNLLEAIEAIAFAKTLNAGQTCLAPDFICIHENRLEEFKKLWSITINKFFGKNPLANPDYCGIVNAFHFNRLTELIQQSLHEGGHYDSIPESDNELLKIKPLLLSEITWNNTIMSDEIFGPILPIITFRNVEELFTPLMNMKRPLNSYIFSKHKKFIQKVLNHTRSGGVTINQCILNYTDLNLPFGGDHHSGIGKYHGHFGFLEFSHQRAISKKGIFPSTLKLFYPPYKGIKVYINRLLIKLFS